MTETSYIIRTHTNKCNYKLLTHYFVEIVNSGEKPYLFTHFQGETEVKEFENTINSLYPTETLRQIHKYGIKLNLKIDKFYCRNNYDEILDMYKVLDRHINPQPEDRDLEIIPHINKPEERAIYYNKIFISRIIKNEIENPKAFTESELKKLQLLLP